MPSGLGLGLLASLAWGMTDLSGALAARRVGSVGVLAGTQLTSLAILLGIAVVNGQLLGPISVVSPVVAAYGGLTVVLAVVFRGESLAPVQALGAAIATAGIVLTGLVLGGSIRDTRIVGPGVLVALVTMVLFAVLTVALAAPIKQHGWLPVMLGSRLTNTLVGVALLA